jgi:hypothetical protein
MSNTDTVTTNKNGVNTGACEANAILVSHSQARQNSCVIEERKILYKKEKINSDLRNGYMYFATVNQFVLMTV